MSEPPEHRARELALQLISLARHPKMLVVGRGLTREDGKTADREATLALAAAMVYLADALNSGQPITYEEPMRR